MKKIIEILHEIRPEFDFEKSEDFILDGYIDSFDLITLVTAFEKEYGIKIRGVEIVPENFCNLGAMKALLKGHGVTDEI
jgi:acyl carrier protein